MIPGLITANGDPVPLQEIRVSVSVTGFIGHVQADLVYSNREEAPVEALFTFPLDDGAAVFRFEAEIDGRHIVAECQEKQQAKQTYDDAISSGRTAMLLEEDDKTSDIFTCTLGNLPPKTEAKLTLSYVLELPQEADGKLRFTLPTVLNPRYNPDKGQVAAAKGTTYAPAGSIRYTFSMIATIVGEDKIQAVTSVKDKLIVEYSSDRYEAKISGLEDFTYGHDVSFLVQYEYRDKPQVILEKGNSKESGFLQQDVLMVNFYPEVISVATSNRGEYIFVIDRSGSMGFGNKRILNAKEALFLFLKSLPVGCYFNIVSFGSDYSVLFPGGSKEYTEDTLNEAVKLQRDMKADMGGTEILRPLQYIYSQPSIDGHPRQIFLLTDGEVSNVDEVIGLVNRNAQTTRVFTVGIGAGASTSLVNGVARAGKGKPEFIADSERMQPKVMSLLKCAMQPSISSLDVSWKLTAGVSAVTMPVVPPALFGGERLILYALLQGTAKTTKTACSVSITGESDVGPVSFHVTFDLGHDHAHNNHAPLHRLAAEAQIKDLQDKEDASYHAPTKDQIILLSTQSNIASRHTSFVAVDRDRKEIVQGVALCHDVLLPTIFSYSLDTVEESYISLDSAMYSNCYVVEHGAVDKSTHSLDTSNAIQTDSAFFSAGCTLDSDEHTAARAGPGSAGEDLMEMIGLQAFPGYWDLNEDVCALLGVAMDHVIQRATLKDKGLVATLLVVSWLNQKWSSRKSEWGMIAQKAMFWIKSRDLEGKPLYQCLDESSMMLK